MELMIAMAAGTLVLAAVMTSFLSQHRHYLAQDDVVEMQQNGRVAMDMLTREIRMAGFDPTENADAGILTAGPGQLSFTQDITGRPVTAPSLPTDPSDGSLDDAGEIIDFGFSATDDADRNGIPDGAPKAASLGRQTGGLGGYQPIAENIQAIEFLYTIGDGTPATKNPDIAKLNDRSSVQISILARAGNPDQKFTNSMAYTAASGTAWGPYNDNFRRRLVHHYHQISKLGAKMKNNNDQDGFTLIEVVIAIFILTIGILGAAAMQVTSIDGNSTANKLTEAATRGGDELEKLIALPYDDIKDQHTGTNKGVTGLNNTDVRQLMQMGNRPYRTTKF